jgi:hypothetical protein
LSAGHFAKDALQYTQVIPVVVTDCVVDITPQINGQQLSICLPTVFLSHHVKVITAAFVIPDR